MGKVLLYASIAVTLAASTLGFLNKGKLTASQGDLENFKKTSAATIAQTKVELEESRAKCEASTKERDQAIAQVESLKTALEKSESQGKDLQNQLKAMTDKVSGLEAAVARLQPKIDNPPPNEPCVQCAEKQRIIDEKEAWAAKLQGDIKDLQARIDTIINNEKPVPVAPKKRSGLEGRILAVNQAWNFVVLNLGDKNGVVGNAEMLIKRGDQLVGKARVTSVEPSTSIAEIVANSVPRGVSIQPGDNVIYQATAE